MKKIILTEEQKNTLMEIMSEHIPNVKHKRYPYKPENVLLIKRFLDTNCIPADYESIGDNGMPCVTKMVTIVGPSKNPLGNLDKEHLLELLISQHKNMFSDTDERRAFLNAVMEAWFLKAISPLGLLKKNYVELP